MKVTRVVDAEDHISEAAVRESSTNLVPSGSLLVVTRSGILSHTLPVAVTEREVAINQDLKALVPHASVLPRYLLHAFNAFSAAILRACAKHGTTVHNLNTSDLMSFRIPLAPLEEQQSIVAVIEKQFSRLDAGVASLRRALRNLGRMRAAVLDAAVEGRLTAHVGGESLPTWTPHRVSDLASVGSGATPRRGDRRYWESGTVPWVTSGQLNQPFVREPTALITEKALRETSVRVWPKHTLLVAMYGEGRTRGRCSELLIEATTNQACAALVMKPEYESARAFVKLYFDARYEANRRLASGGVQPNLSLGIIKNLTIPLPDADVRDEIVAIVESQLSKLEALERAIDMALLRGTRMRSSILLEAFAGRLSDQQHAEEALIPKTSGTGQTE